MILDVYQADKAGAELCRDMQRVGFAYDTQRATELSTRLRTAEAAARDAADAAVIAAGGAPIARTKTNGFSTKDLTRAFRETLRAPVYFRSQLTGAPSYGVETLRAYAAAHNPQLRALAVAMLEWRRARKIRTTYIDSVRVGLDGRVHPTWMNYGAVSGRWACQAPNLMNLPRPMTDPTRDVGGIRSLYVARKGYVLVVFDKKQLEMRVAAYVTGDENMIAACESKDLHDWNATAIFGEAFTECTDPAQRKALRTLAKTSGFAVCYFAEAATVYSQLIAAGQQVKMREVEAMCRRLHRAFAGYYRWQADAHRTSIRTGYMVTPILGRRRWVGHDASPTEGNYHVQGGAADIMNATLPVISAALRERSPKSSLVAQVHDAAAYEVPLADAELVTEICTEINHRPVTIASSGKTLSAVFPIDIETSERWH